MKGASEWGSVRKIRSLTQIMALLEAASRSRKEYQDDVRESLVKQHIVLERARQRGSQTGYRPFEQIRSGLHALTEDNLSFLKRMSFAKEINGKLVLSADSRRLLDEWRKDDIAKVRKLVIRRLLLSPYKAYISYLQNMKRIGGSFRVRARGEKRTRASRLRQRLHDLGFETDVASFYTIRDLFYDLKLLNTVTDMRGRFETIFLTSVLTGASTRLGEFSSSIRVGRFRLHFDRKITDPDFCKHVVEGYKTISRTWSRWVSLIILRNVVVHQLRISDEDFNTLMEKVNLRGGCDGFKVDGSTGYRVSRRQYGLVLKSMRMPLTTGGRPIQYVAVSRLKS